MNEESKNRLDIFAAHALQGLLATGRFTKYREMEEQPIHCTEDEFGSEEKLLACELAVRFALSLKEKLDEE